MNKLSTKIKPWKPNWLQRFLYWSGIRKDPRFNGRKYDWMKLDELMMWENQHGDKITEGKGFCMIIPSTVFKGPD